MGRGFDPRWGHMLDAESGAPLSPNNGRYAPLEDLSGYAWLSIGAAVITIMLKGGAAWLTGSVGLLSDAAESGVNLVAAVLALIALKVSIRPPDDGHPFGHSKAEYFSAIVEGVMIFVASAFIITTAADRLFAPKMPQQLGLGLAITVVASLINGAVAWVLLRKGREVGSATLIADGQHLVTDVITSGAVLLGVALVALTKQARLDPVVAMLAGVNILWTGFSLMRHSVNALMDASLPASELDAIEEVLSGYRSADVEFHALRTRVSGNRHFMTLHVLVPGKWSVIEGHDLTEDLIDALVVRVPGLRITAHLEPKEDPRSYDDLEI